MFWRLLERFSTQAVGFVVSLVLARLLGPKAYGTIALLTIFIAVSGVFVDCGFGTALIQRKDVTDEDYNSVFYLSIGLSLILYGILFVCAPWIADFYSQPILVPVLRVMAISLIINAINGVQNAVLARGMLFNLSFRISLAQSVSMGAIGITLAYLGYGVWALVWANLGSSLIGTAVRWSLIGWQPRLMFAWASVRSLFGFSWKLLVSGLLDSFFVNMYGLVIGRVYTPSDLAFFNKGQQFPRAIMDSVNGTLGTVAFPALSQLQDDKDRLRNAMRKMIQCSTYLVMPAMAGLAVCARPLVSILLGSAWLPAVPYLQIGCFTYALWPFHTINLQAINAVGRSDVFLKLEIIKKAMVIVVLVGSYRFGVLALAMAGAFVSSPLSVLINAWPNRRLIGYGIKAQIHDVLPSAGLALAMAGLMVLPDVFYPGMRATIRLGLEIVLGSLAFLALSCGFRLAAWQSILLISSALFKKVWHGIGLGEGSSVER